MRPEPALTGARATKRCGGRLRARYQDLVVGQFCPELHLHCLLKGLPNLLNVCQC